MYAGAGTARLGVRFSLCRRCLARRGQRRESDVRQYARAYGVVGEDYGDGSNYDDMVSAIGGADVRYAAERMICDEEFVAEHSDNLWDHMILLGQARPLEYRIVTEPFFRYGEEFAMTDRPLSCFLRLRALMRANHNISSCKGRRPASFFRKRKENLRYPARLVAFCDKRGYNLFRKVSVC